MIVKTLEDLLKAVAVIGLANTYATHSSIPPQGQSGFKISAGTFVTETPASWYLYAVGSKHRGN